MRTQSSRRQRNGRSRAQVSRQQIALQHKVPRVLSFVEVKGFDNAISTAFAAVPPISSDVLQIPSAGGVEDRDGLRVTMAELQIRYFVQGTAGAGGPFGAGTNYLARVIILQTTRQGLSVADVLDNTLGLNVYSPYNLANVGQDLRDSAVYILHDKVYNLNPAHYSSAEWNGCIKGKDFPIQSPRYASVATAAPVHGGVQFIVLTNQTVAGQFPSLQGATRLLFTDA